jgi:hypothetical protein
MFASNIILISFIVIEQCSPFNTDKAKHRFRRQFGGDAYDSYDGPYYNHNRSYVLFVCNYSKRILYSQILNVVFIIIGCVLFIICCCCPCICGAGIYFSDWFGLRSRMRTSRRTTTTLPLQRRRVTQV